MTNNRNLETLDKGYHFLARYFSYRATLTVAWHLSTKKWGLTQTDAVQGAQAKWKELYEQYYERHFVTGNDEMRRLRKSCYA